MAITILKKEEQVKGAFDGGKILENKPIAFPQEGGKLTGYSNLFYWANAWSDNGGLIAEHPHRFFEIMSFVLDGSIEHYDNKNKKWISLNKGDVQIIRAGKGITHAEKILPGGRMFQIWFDPDINKTYLKEATYNDYHASQFFKKPVGKGIYIINYAGEHAPIEMDTEKVEIFKLIMEGNLEYELKEYENAYLSMYCLKGSCKINNNLINTDDFVKIVDENKILIQTLSPIEIFIIKNPKKLTYSAYLEMSF